MKRARVQEIDVETLSTEGLLIIKRPFHEDIRIFLPILKVTELDTSETFYSDAFETCNRFVPKLPGISKDFVEEFAKFKHVDTKKMLTIFEFARDRLQYDKFNGDNPGHLFIAMQIFGGWWGGVAREIFVKCLRGRGQSIKEELDKKFNIVTPDSKVDEIALGVLASICKCFGSAARTPLLPHIPFGSPPNIVSTFTDYLVAIYPILFKYKDVIYKKMRDWHVPAYARDDKGVFRTSWESYNQVDRIQCMITHQISNL